MRETYSPLFFYYPRTDLTLSYFLLYFVLFFLFYLLFYLFLQSFVYSFDPIYPPIVLLTSLPRQSFFYSLSFTLTSVLSTGG